jgi:hypothetical protein
MMKVLELLAIKADMLKIMATIFKNDKPEVILCSLLFSTVGKRFAKENGIKKNPDPEISKPLFGRALKNLQSVNFRHHLFVKRLLQISFRETTKIRVLFLETGAFVCYYVKNKNGCSFYGMVCKMSLSS